MKKQFIIIILIILSLLMISKFIVNGDNDFIEGDIDDEEEILTTNKDVKQRNLVRENLTAKQILNNYNKYFKNTNLKSFSQGNTLAYITPWNGKGYDIGIKFANKFSHLSPVWYQIKFENNKYLIEGDHNVDKNWIEKVKDQSNKKTKIVPRFSFEGQGWSKLDSFQKSFKDSKFIDSLLLILKNNNYDGLVLEGISHVNRQLRDQFLITLGDKLHLINKELFLVISPFKQKGQDTGFNNKDFEKLSDHVDGFSLMTYDYRPDAPMNSPKIWCEDNLKLLLQNSQKSQENSKKIYMGLPFYGYKVESRSGKTDAIVGSQFIDILKENKSKKLKWNSDSHEHYFNFNDKKNSGGAGTEVSLTYPTLLFLDQRIQLAIQYKVSISIWEIGQGLDFFMDLL